MKWGFTVGAQGGGREATEPGGQGKGLAGWARGYRGSFKGPFKGIYRDSIRV